MLRRKHSKLKRLEEIVARWQLLEFRPTLDMIVCRLEQPRFEIAVFGRVSSGKSSLLNHIAGFDVLPVGVTPVTAVPTWLEHGRNAAVVVSFSESPPRRIATNELWSTLRKKGTRQWQARDAHCGPASFSQDDRRSCPGGHSGIGSLATFVARRRWRISPGVTWTSCWLTPPRSSTGKFSSSVLSMRRACRPCCC